MRIAPLAARVVLTDRADGAQWLLSFVTDPSPVDGFGYITLNSNLGSLTQDTGNVRVFDANFGPYLYGPPTVRLLVRGGYLGFEEVTGAISGARIVARRLVQRDTRVIIFPEDYQNEQVLAWTPANFAENFSG